MGNPVKCARKTCAFQYEHLFYGPLCKKDYLSISAQGKCESYEKKKKWVVPIEKLVVKL